MKNYYFKSILFLVLSLLALPMMGQDYMYIIFKNGDFRKFYMKNVMEITTSKYDASGVQHSGYDYQHITTIYDKYVYNLEDINCITFTKIDEELAEHNFVSAMPTVFNIISDCESIVDVEGKIGQIKNAEGVEDAWSDGHQLYVKIGEGETFSFHFNHDSSIDDDSYAKSASQIRAMLPRLTNVVKENGSQLKAVIANQQHKDEDRKSYIDNYYTPLKKAFNECGIRLDYVDEPNIDFFYDHCKDPDHAKHLNIYDYDIIFLITHGSFTTKKYFNDVTQKAEDMDFSCHSFATSEDIFMLKESAQFEWSDYYHLFREWRDDSSYKDATDFHINYGFNKEKRGNRRYWIAHPSLLEMFFSQIVPTKTKFLNPNSIIFNTACQSLKGEVGKDNPSFTLAEEFLQRNLGVYLGYDESNEEGKIAGYHFLSNMLYGMSFEKALAELSEEEKHDNVVEDGKKYVANLHFWPQDNANVEKLFFCSTYTEPIDHETVMDNYNFMQAVEVVGWTTSRDPAKITGGFEYDTDESFSSSREAINVECLPLTQASQKGNARFRGKLTNLEPNKTYYYRAYTYDGMNYNYGEPCSFKIDKSNIPPSYTKCPDDHHPHMIDLGLPSGTKWACCNVGALNPEDYGDYFAWGETKEKVSFEPGNCTSYDIGGDIARTRYDAATANWGYSWVMPNKEQMEELINNCTSDWATENGVNGYRFIGSNGKSIFLPAAGARWFVGSADYDGSQGNYWLSTPYGSDYAYDFLFNGENVGMSAFNRYYGQSIRAIASEVAPLCPDDHHPHMIDLGLPSGTKWACCNVGALKPEDYGGYFAWGETNEKSSYTSGNYLNGRGTSYFIGNDITNTQYDVAKANWGSSWVMPNLEQMKELNNNCISEWITENGVYGRRFIGSNGASIFLPAAGLRGGTALAGAGSYGIYWSSVLYELDTSNAWYFYLRSEGAGTSYDDRSYGPSVRPVKSDAAPVYPDLWLSQTRISIDKGNSTTVEITSGCGEYEYNLSNDGIVSVSFSGSTVTINALRAGQTTVTIVDTKSGQTATIDVTVTGGGDIPSYTSCPDNHHPHLIDLGLPSGTKWACCNVGAQKPEDYGGYYAWGETTEKSNYTIDNYLGGNGMSYYIGKDISGTQYDVATAKWSYPWIMPNQVQMKELFDNCTSKWATENGINGRWFTGSNGFSIFLPAAGIHFTDNLREEGSGGYYWSSIPDESHAEGILVECGGVSMYNGPRFTGISVRPVQSAFSLNSQIVMTRKVLVHHGGSYYNGGYYRYPLASFFFDNDKVLTIGYYDANYWFGSYGNSEKGIHIILGNKHGDEGNGAGDPGYQIKDWYIAPNIIDEWFTEKIVIHADGRVQYYLNDDYKGEEVFDELNLSGASTFKLLLSPYGWWTGHYTFMDDFFLSTPSVTYSDNFNDGVIDLKIWKEPANPDGVREESGIIKMEQLRTDVDYNLRIENVPLK